MKLKQKYTREQIVDAIVHAGGAAEFVRLMRERRANPGAKLFRDETGRFRYA